MPENNWWQKGALGTEAWGDERRFLQFLANVYGTWLLGLGSMAIYSFRNHPLRKWWTEHDKPTSAGQYRQELEKYRESIEQARPSWEVAAELPERLLVSEYPEPPVEAGEGFEWHKVTHEGGVPVQPEWRMRAIEEEEVEEAPFTLTPWEEWQKDIEERKFAWEQQGVQRDISQQYLEHMGRMQDWRERQAYQSRATFGVQAQGTGWRSEVDVYRQEQEQRGKLWEDWRKRMLGSLDPDRDWMQRYQLEQQRNPYQVQETSMVEQAAIYKTKLALSKKEFGRQQQILAGMPAGEFVPQTPKQASAFGALVRETQKQTALQNWIKEAEASPEYQEEIGRAGIGEVPEGGWGMVSREAIEAAGGVPMPSEPARPTTPATPSWMRELYPQMGAHVEKRELAPLSGQFWGRMKPSERAQWWGYAKWAGGKPEDLLWQTQQMLPRQPRIAGGWAPARQRA